MAKKYQKRLFDAHIHRDPEFRKLPLRMREAWRVLCGECDYLGIWKVDLEALRLYVGEEISLAEIRAAFKVRAIDNEKALFLLDFVRFQCCDESGKLNPRNSYHVKVANALRTLGLPGPDFKDLQPKGDTPPPPGGTQTPTRLPPLNKNKSLQESLPETEEGGVGETTESVGGWTPPQEAWPFQAPLETHDVVQVLSQNLSQASRLALSTASVAAQRAWLEAHPDPDWIRQELLNCLAHLAHRRPRNPTTFPAFFGAWLRNNWRDRKPAQPGRSTEPPKLSAWAQHLQKQGGAE